MKKTILHEIKYRQHRQRRVTLDAVIHTSFRLPLSTIQRLDALAAALRKRQVGKVTRADVLRQIITGGIARMERQFLPAGNGRERAR